MIGADGSAVFALQERLVQLGYLRQADNFYGQEVEAALRQFQLVNGLAETGEAAPETVALLNAPEALANDMQLPALKQYDLVVDVSDQKVFAYDKKTGALLREMICSTGLEETPTPLGVYHKQTGPGARWHYFKSLNCWAQYAFYIDGDIMFHSVLFERRGGELSESSEANLGARASHGSVRLRVEDAQWIWEHCPTGTKVTVQA